MKTIKIPKKSGGTRTVYVPDSPQKEYLGSLLPELNRLQAAFADSNERKIMASLRNVVLSTKNHFRVPVVHGFMPGRSAVSNANAHRGYRYTLSVDVKDCFDSTTPDLVLRAVAGQPDVEGFVKRHAWALFVDGSARQGLPTSPAMANLALANVDSVLIHQCCRIWVDSLDKRYWWDKVRGRGIGIDIADFLNQPAEERISSKYPHVWTYTRYADDITISCNDEWFIRSVMASIGNWIAETGYRVNGTKTRLQVASFGRRTITGVAVDNKIQATRAARRKLRAALHNKNQTAARGLEEWIKTRMPGKM